MIVTIVFSDTVHDGQSEIIKSSQEFNCKHLAPDILPQVATIRGLYKAHGTQ